MKGLGDQSSFSAMSGSGSRALNRQYAMAASRFPPATARDDASSSASWEQVDPTDSDGLQLPPANLTLGTEKLQPVPENVPVQPKAPPPQMHAPTPAQQAAQGLVNHDNENSASRKLRHAQERAARRGNRRMRWGQLGVHAHNPVNTQLPEHISQVGSGQDERSGLILDSRDRRMQSPYQGWLLDEILVNAHGNLNVVSDRHMVRSPSSGYHMNLFMMKTLDGMKVIMCGSMTSYGSVPCGRWDSETAEVLAHEAFQPFRWPMMTEESPTWVDVKVKVEGHQLLHLELRGYRADGDMTVQVNHVSDSIAYLLSTTVFIPTFVVTIFQGWRVVAVSWEVGGRLYACSEGGMVVALDYPLCHFECRFVATASPDAFGVDADRLEFRFLSAADRLDVRASTCSVPPSWLVVSRVSGPNLIKNARWCRDHYARVESPDQQLQLSQLASVHAHWTASTEAPSEDDTGPRISAVSVESNPSNVHLICESPLFRKARVNVAKEALALQSHDVDQEKEIKVLPPITGGPAVQPLGPVQENLHMITGQFKLVETSLAVAPVSTAQPSLTDPGVAPTPGSAWEGNALAPARRSLDARRIETMDRSAWTPAAFVQEVRRAQGAPPTSSREAEEIKIEIMGGSLDGSEGAHQGPRSYGPSNPPK